MLVINRNYCKNSLIYMSSTENPIQKLLISIVNSKQAPNNKEVITASWKFLKCSMILNILIKIVKKILRFFQGLSTFHQIPYSRYYTYYSRCRVIFLSCNLSFLPSSFVFVLKGVSSAFTNFRQDYDCLTC